MNKRLLLFVSMLVLILPAIAKKYQPVIGITMTIEKAHHKVGDNYVQAVLLAGGIPYLIPAITDESSLKEIIHHLDGLLFTGGDDISPTRYGEPPHPLLGEVNHVRDSFELTLFRLADQQGLPIFGICRGMQMINVARKGTLYQDIPSEFQTQLVHRQTDDSRSPAHSISILPESQSAKVFGTTQLEVNSRHHQCVKKVGEGLTVTAWSSDSVPEMLEAYPQRAILAIQSHPEIFTVHNHDQQMKAFFDLLIKEARTYSRQIKKKK